MIYLDNASTTRTDDRVLEAMLPYLRDEYGNPGGQYPLGFAAAEAINHARPIKFRGHMWQRRNVLFGGMDEGRMDERWMRCGGEIPIWNKDMRFKPVKWQGLRGSDIGGIYLSTGCLDFFFVWSATCFLSAELILEGMIKKGFQNAF